MPPGGEPIAAAAVKPDDLALILYTSGTTGPSKGVCCPQAQYFWWAVNTASLLEIKTGDVLCTSLPLFHTNALNTFYQALLTGSTVRYEKRFSASGFYSGLVNSQRHRHLSARRHGADPAVAAGDAGGNRAHRADRARPRRAGAIPRAIHQAHRHPPARRLGLDRDQFRASAPPSSTSSPA